MIEYSKILPFTPIAKGGWSGRIILAAKKK
jgi:hypothetical protein